jgi:hypothetical protein
MKQTAIEWLVEQICGDHTSEWQKQIEQAKEMEKEQIIESVVNTVKVGTEKEGVLLFTNEDEILIRNESEQYYKETFKSE